MSELKDQLDIPFPLNNRQKWLVADNNKQPVEPFQWDDVDNLLNYETAVEYADYPDFSLAFVLTDDDPFVVFDFDDVVVNKTEFSTQTKEYIEKLNSYTELSTSGKGAHVFVRGRLLDERLSRFNNHDRGHVEVYDKNRYIIMTTDRLKNFGPEHGIPERQMAINYVHSQFPKSNTEGRAEWSTNSAENSGSSTELTMPFNTVSSGSTTSISADRIQRTIEAYAEDSKDAEKCLNLLQSSGALKYKSPSEADLALCGCLAFWTRNDEKAMKQLWLESRRGQRPKVQNRDDYVDQTISRAVNGNSDTFSGTYVN
jgi:putative DNA primase/helicase